MIEQGGKFYCAGVVVANDRMIVAALIDELVDPNRELVPEHVRAIVAHFDGLERSSVVYTVLRSVKRSNHTGMVTNVGVLNSKDEKQIETHEYGRKTESIGKWKFWRDSNQRIHFRHFLGSPLVESVRYPEYFIVMSESDDKIALGHLERARTYLSIFGLLVYSRSMGKIDKGNQKSPLPVRHHVSYRLPWR